MMLTNDAWKYLNIKVTQIPTQGRLVNIQNYSLSTIASVIKKFLRKVTFLIFVGLGAKY